MPPPADVSPASNGPLAVARALVSVLSSGGRAAMATVIARSGSAPQVVGARLLLRDDGALFGTVGGGAVEARVLAACRESLADGQPRRFEAHLVRDLGMCCGGAMEVFVELVQGASRLFLIGAGKVVRAVAELARSLEFSAVVVAPGADLPRPDPWPPDPWPDDVTTLSCADYGASLAAALPPGRDDDFFLIATGDHRADARALGALLGARPYRLLAMIGSRRKVREALSRVAEERGRALEPTALARVRAPVGLALGGRTPGEIAVSILADFIAERRGGTRSRMNVVPAAAARIADA